MNEMGLERQRSLDRHSLGGWMHKAIDWAEALPVDRLVRRTVAPAGLTLDILIDDPALAEIYFARLAAGRGPAGSRLDRLYVLSSDASALASPLWADADCSAKAFQSAVLQTGQRAAYPLIPRFWQFFDAGRRVGVQLAPDRQHLPRWDAAAPLRRHLHWLLEERGSRLVHAATLGLGGRGLLVLGKGGAGKSGATLAGLAVGLSTAGDDYIALEGGTPPVARSLYRIVKQDREGLGRIPGLSGRLVRRRPNWQGKIEFDPEEIFPGAAVDDLALMAVILPRIARGSRPSIVPIPPSMAMLSLMSTNLLQHLGEPERGVAFFAGILRRLPCYRIDLADDAMANGAMLRHLIETVPE